MGAGLNGEGDNIINNKFTLYRLCNIQIYHHNSISFYQMYNRECVCKAKDVIKNKNLPYKFPHPLHKDPVI